MGWWSPMIMGGDPPAEWRGVLGNIAGADDPFNPLTAEQKNNALALLYMLARSY